MTSIEVKPTYQMEHFSSYFDKVSPGQRVPPPHFRERMKFIETLALSWCVSLTSLAAADGQAWEEKIETGHVYSSPPIIAYSNLTH